jgi:hypothetical protein
METYVQDQFFGHGFSIPEQMGVGVLNPLES